MRWLIVGLVTVSACSTNPTAEQAHDSATVTTVPDQQAATLTTAPDPNAEPPVSGAVGDLENPISLLEDGSSFDPAWSSNITLTCGPEPDNRTIAIVATETNNRGVPTLYRQEPSNGGFTTEPVKVGSIVEADPALVWAVQGILLGPWAVDTVTDTCGNEQANGLIPYVTLAAEQRAGAPGSTDIATTQQEVDLLAAERDLEPFDLKPDSVVLSFVYNVSSTPECGHGPLIGLRYSEQHATLGPWLAPPPEPDLGPDEDLACNDDINPYGFVVLVDRADLPDGEFFLSLEPDRKAFPTLDAFLTTVDNDRRSTQPFGDIPILVPGDGLAVGESGVALHVLTDCGRAGLFFDLDGSMWEGITNRYELSESWLAATSGNDRINLILTKFSDDEVSAVPARGGDFAIYRRNRGTSFEPCPFVQP